MDTIEGDPRDGLRRALAELSEAERLRGTAAETAERALQRMARCEAELEGYADLDARIDAWSIGQVRSGGPAELPYTLASAARERAVAQDRLEHARRAHTALVGEIRAAEQAVLDKKQQASKAAQRVLIARADTLAADLEHAMTDTKTR
jgi:hypothetical protein